MSDIKIQMIPLLPPTMSTLVSVILFGVVKLLFFKQVSRLFPLRNRKGG